LQNAGSAFSASEFSSENLLGVQKYLEKIDRRRYSVIGVRSLTGVIHLDEPPVEEKQEQRRSLPMTNYFGLCGDRERREGFDFVLL
jgi:hypothetical protein